MEYKYNEIEKKWQAYWAKNGTYTVTEDTNKPKYYILDMFPYPSGAGLHVGHPLGYIASDILARYMRHKGYNVLHPMGYDSFGLPAEQYAIQTGQHPEITTRENTRRYRQQLDNIGFCYDWNRSFNTSDPDYYKWTQWAFIQMFNAYYDTAENKAKPIANLVEHLQQHGTQGLNAFGSTDLTLTPQQWNNAPEKEQQQILMNYRIAFLDETMVNWCPQLGTVLANDEVSEGVSIRGGHPVEQRRMLQWCLRVSAYADRLLAGLETLDWSAPLKEMQRNWIGRSEGAEVQFPLQNDTNETLTVFTTRADTLFGVTFMVLAPESEYVQHVTTPQQKEEVLAYCQRTKMRTERERLMDKQVSGVFTGGYALHPITKEPIPIWVSDYVLAGYGTGAVMAVPAHDTRDFAFARHFNLPIIPVVKPSEGEWNPNPQEWKNALDSHSGVMIHSDFLDGLLVDDAIARMKQYLQQSNIGKVKTNYRLRNAIFSRQRFWGEPFPIYYKEGMPYTLDESKLPLILPEVDKFLPTESGEPPLGRATNWNTPEGYPLELSTMPGFAGSSAYYLRYMDPHNPNALVDRKKNEYWRSVDIYVGGTEHATGHLIYSRFWNKFLYDLGYVCEDEPFRRLINQGMIQGRSNFVYRIKDTNTYVSYGLKEQYDTTAIHVDIHLVHNDKLNTNAFRDSLPERANANFVLENGEYICGWAVEKMSKSYLNVVNPDDIIRDYGADTLRLYEMFLGPLEQSKPWDTNGIDGVHRFLKKFYAVFVTDEGELALTNDEPTKEELKVLHKTIKKIRTGIESISFNTCVSSFMICLNELQALKCRKRAIWEPLVTLLAPFCPHICEELWHLLGHETTVVDSPYPEHQEAFLVEDTVKYPISFNGKVRFTLELPHSLSAEEIQDIVLKHELTQKQLGSTTPKKVIVVPGRIVNIVC